MTNAVGSARHPIDRAWTWLVIGTSIVVASLARLGATDLAYHVRAGSEMLSGRMLLRSDSWTFTVSGEPWANQQWGAQVILSTLYDIGGWALIYLSGVILAGLTVWLVFVACRAAGADATGAATLTLAGALVAHPWLGMRPQLLVAPLFALSVLAVRDRGNRPRILWLLPICAAVASNFHGSFVLVPALAGAAFAEDVIGDRARARSTALVFASTIAATFVNPLGTDVWSYVIGLATNEIIRELVTEWMAPVPTRAVTLPFYLSILALLAFMARRTRALAWGDVAWLSVFLIMALATQRAIVWWGLVAPPIVAASIVRPNKPRELGSPTVARAIIVLSIVVAILIPWMHVGSSMDTLENAPRGLAAGLESVPSAASVFVHQPWASWFELEAPDKLYFADTRIEIFPEEVWEDYLEVEFAGAGWKGVVDRWHIDVIVLERAAGLVPILREDPAWSVDYEDEDGVIFVRT